VKEYVGGYEDWLRQRPEPAQPRVLSPLGKLGTTPRRVEGSDAIPKKLTYREREELEGLPARIEALEQEQQALAAKIAGPDFYKESADAIRQALDRVERIHDELLEAMARWDELESRPR
jgi:ATP-binding cassette subfamily F protein uup